MSDVNNKQLDRLYRYLEAHPDNLLLAAFIVTGEGELIISGPDAVRDMIVELTGDITIREAMYHEYPST